MTLYATYSALRHRLFGPPPADDTERNIRYLYLEILFASVLGGIITFNSAFAIRLGASKDLNAWLSAAPALIAAIASIPSARFLARRTNRRLWLWGSLLAVRGGYIVVAFMPLLFPVNTALWLVIWIIALNLPAILFGNGFTVLLGELVPERRRAFVFSRRSIIYSIGLVLVSALAGAWLDNVGFPGNYQWMYIFGFVVVLGSHYYLHRLTFNDAAVAGPSRARQAAPETSITVTPAMTRMLINTAVYQFGLTLPAALFNILYIESLHVTDGWLGLNSAAANAGVIVGFIVWERVLRRHNFGWVQRRASLLTWIFPVVLALAQALALAPTPQNGTDLLNWVVLVLAPHALTLIMLANFVVNVMHSGAELANSNVLLKLARPEHRVTFISWYNTVVNAAIFVGPLLGAWLAGQIGIPGVLLLSGVFRLLGGALFSIRRIEEPTDSAPHT
jgi:MFS family permease